LIDQDRDGLAQIGRRLAFGEQNVLAVKIRKGKPVARQIRRRHHAVGRKLGAERREIEAGIAAIGPGHPQHQRMRLLPPGFSFYRPHRPNIEVMPKPSEQLDRQKPPSDARAALDFLLTSSLKMPVSEHTTRLWRSSAHY